jgi:hypothetical protein
MRKKGRCRRQVKGKGIKKKKREHRGREARYKGKKKGRRHEGERK